MFVSVFQVQDDEPVRTRSAKRQGPRSEHGRRPLARFSISSGISIAWTASRDWSSREYVIHGSCDEKLYLENAARKTFVIQLFKAVVS